MTTYWRGYFGIENLNLNDNQRDQIVAVLEALGDKESPYPHLLNHWRTRLDRQAAIYESRWNEDHLTIDKFKQYLAEIFNIDPVSIDHEVTTPGSNLVIVLSRNSTDYLRVALFGGLSSTWEESRLAAVAYILANAEEWEDPEL